MKDEAQKAEKRKGRAFLPHNRLTFEIIASTWKLKCGLSVFAILNMIRRAYRNGNLRFPPNKVTTQVKPKWFLILDGIRPSLKLIFVFLFFAVAFAVAFS